MTGLTRPMTGTGAGFTVTADVINGFGNRLSGRSEAVHTASASLGAIEVTPDMFGPAAHRQGFTAAMAQSTQRITDLLSNSAEAIENAAVGTKKTAEEYAVMEEQNTTGFGEGNFGLPGAVPEGVNPMGGGPGYGGGMGSLIPGGGVAPMPVGGGVGPPMPGAAVDPMLAGGGIDPMSAGGGVNPSMSGGGPGAGTAFTPPRIPPIGMDPPGVGGLTGSSATAGGPPGLTDPSSMVSTMPHASSGTGPPAAPTSQPPTPQMRQPQAFVPPMPQLPVAPPSGARDKVRNAAPDQSTPPQRAWMAPRMPEMPTAPVASEPVTHPANVDTPSLRSPLAGPPPDLGTGGGGTGSLPGGGPALSGGPGPGSVPQVGAPPNLVGAAPPSSAMPSGVMPAGMTAGHGGPGGTTGGPMGGMGGMGGGQSGGQERKSASYIKGEDVFTAPQENPPPPVIGGAPPKQRDPAPPATN